jgi:hypothetical protein
MSNGSETDRRRHDCRHLGVGGESRGIRKRTWPSCRSIAAASLPERYAQDDYSTLQSRRLSDGCGQAGTGPAARPCRLAGCFPATEDVDLSAGRAGRGVPPTRTCGLGASTEVEAQQPRQAPLDAGQVRVLDREPTNAGVSGPERRAVARRLGDQGSTRASANATGSSVVLTEHVSAARTRSLLRASARSVASGKEGAGGDANGAGQAECGARDRPRVVGPDRAAPMRSAWDGRLPGPMPSVTVDAVGPRPTLVAATRAGTSGTRPE